MQIRSPGPARVAILGGAPLPEPRSMMWNFVSASKEKVQRAAQAWEEGDESQFPQVPGEEGQPRLMMKKLGRK